MLARGFVAFARATFGILAASCSLNVEPDHLASVPPRAAAAHPDVSRSSPSVPRGSAGSASCADTDRPVTLHPTGGSSPVPWPRAEGGSDPTGGSPPDGIPSSHGEGGADAPAHDPGGAGYATSADGGTASPPGGASTAGGEGGSAQTQDAGRAGASGSPADGAGSPGTLVAFFGSATQLSTEDEVLEELVRHAKAAPLLHSLGFSATEDYQLEAARALDPGWERNGQPPLPMVPPIDWGTAVNGDRNWHFNLNSFRPAAPFLMDYEQSQRLESLDRVRDLALDWIDYNLTRNHSNSMKWYDMAVGFRAHLFAVILQEMLLAGPDPAVVDRFVDALYPHAVYLADPAHRPSSNHILAMTLGLLSLCYVLPYFEDCPAWEAYAHSEMEAYLNASVSSEGLSLEHSPGYQVYIADSLDQYRRTGLYAQALDDAVRAMRAVQHWMYHPNGDLVLVNDSIQYGSQRPVHPYLEYVISEGTQGTRPPDGPVVFNEAGIGVYRTPWTQRSLPEHSYLFFSAGYHSSTHKHADNLTFEWSDVGVPVVVDSGAFTYNAGTERDFFVSTRAGNTVEIDEQDDDVSGEGALGSSLVGSGTTASGAWYIAASMDRPGRAVRHDRLLAVRDADWMLVVDCLSGEWEHQYVQTFGLHENIGASTDGRTVVLALPDGRQLFVEQLDSGAALPELVTAQTVPRLQGWVSREYGVMLPRTVVSWQSQGSSVCMETLFSHDRLTDRAVVPTASGFELSWSGGDEGNVRLDVYHDVDSGELALGAGSP
jgi:hypothetical protein